MKGNSGIIMVVLVSLLAVGALYYSFRSEPMNGDLGVVSSTASEGVYLNSLVDLQGNQVGMDPEKLIFLNVWATWCGPCNMEMPGIQTLYDKYKDNDKVAFYIVSDEDAETVAPFISRKGYQLPFYQYAGRFPQVLDGNAIPRTYIIYKGQVLKEGIGAAHWDTPEIHDLFERALRDA